MAAQTILTTFKPCVINVITVINFMIKHGNCLELFKTIPSNSIDVAFADPPFNLGKKYSDYKDVLDDKEYVEWCHKWLDEMIRVVKPTGSIFIHNIPKWLTFYAAYLNGKAHFRHWIAWDASSGPMGKSLQPSHYGILYYTKEVNSKFYEIRAPHKRCRTCHYLLKDYGGKKAALHPFGPLVSDVWADIHRVKHNKYKDDHPCQLPIHLLERIILMSSDENDIIIDPFMGTGTTAIAAKRLGRQYVGFDLSEEYVAAAKTKLSHEGPSKIGDVWVSQFNKDVVTVRDIDVANLLKHYEVPEHVPDLNFTRIRKK